METTIHKKVSRATIQRVVSKASKSKDQNKATNDLLIRLGVILLNHIKEAFIAKANGRTDEAGERWAPLSPSTIAYSRTAGRRGPARGGRTRSEKGRSGRPSQALSKKQQERWWALYRQGLAMFKGDKGSAARRAWSIVKGEGATTLFDKYSNRTVQILIDSGKLLRSLTAGTSNPDNVFRVGQDEIVIGTSRKGALAHHNGVPGKLPQRRLWPPTDKWPDRWWKDLADETARSVVKSLEVAVRGS